MPKTPDRHPHPLAIGRRGFLRATAFSAIGIGLSACGAESQGSGERLGFLNWDNYTGRTTLADFQKMSGIRVQARYFNSSDELLQRMATARGEYDVIVPSNETLPALRKANLLAPLNLDKIPNFSNITPEYHDTDYDPEPRHSIPYTWLVTGIGYRKSRVNGVPDSWKWLYESDLYKGRIALPSNGRDIIRIGAKYLGRPLNDIDEDTIQRVEEMLIRQKPNIRLFHQDNGQDLLLAGDVDLVMEFNGDIAQVAREDPDIGFVVPNEGSVLNADTLAIARSSRKIDLAHRFINFLLDGEVGKGIAETILYPTPNATAKALMPESYRSNTIIYPEGPGIDNSEWGEFPDAETTRLYNEAMATILNA